MYSNGNQNMNVWSLEHLKYHGKIPNRLKFTTLVKTNNCLQNTFTWSWRIALIWES